MPKILLPDTSVFSLIKLSPSLLLLLFTILLVNWQRPHVSGECCLKTSYYKQGYCINRIITQYEYILWTRISIHMCTASSKCVSSKFVLSFLTRRSDWNMTYREFSEWQGNIAHSTKPDQSTSQPTPSWRQALFSHRTLLSLGKRKYVIEPSEPCICLTSTI